MIIAVMFAFGTTNVMAKDKNPIFGGGNVETMSKADMKNTIAKGYVADSYGYDGFIYSYYANLYAYYGYYYDDYSSENTYYYYAQDYAYTAYVNLYYAWYYAGS